MALSEKDYFITIWKTTTANESITIPVNLTGNTYDYDVDWGDNNGAFETGFTEEATHTYTTPGEYTVKIRGVFPHFYSRNKINSDKIISIEQWGSIAWESMDSMFFGCTNLIGNTTDQPDLSKVTDMRSMFQGASSFNQAIGNWDVSKVTNMDFMFEKASSFNQPLGNWNVGNVTSMAQMFSNAPLFNQPIGNWDVSKVTYMGAMFFRASSFNQPIGNWDVSKVTYMGAMFKEARSFNQPVGEWDVSKITTMGSMFSSARSFNQPIGDWNVSEVKNMLYMFYQAGSFNQPVGEWDVSKVTTMRSMFRQASSFNQPIGKWKVNEVKDMSHMFSSLSSFNQPIGEWNVSKVTTMSHMFNNASTFNQAVGDWNVSEVKDMSYMFSSARSFNQPIGDWNVSKVTNMSAMFQQADSFNQPIGDWEVSSVENMRTMFGLASSFNQPIGEWDVSKVTTMQSMFYRAEPFNQDISSWDVSKVTIMRSMFKEIKISTENYDALLIGWSAQLLQQNVIFDGGESNYCKGEVARTKLIDSFNWTVTDAGKLCPEPVFDLSTSTIIANPNTIAADGIEQATVTVQLKDSLGDNIIIGGEIVTILTNLGIITTTIDNGNGSYTASLSSVVAGSALLTFTVNGTTSSKTTAVKFKAVEIPVFDLSTSTIIANPNKIAADGIEQAAVTVQLKDNLGNNITAGGETVVILTNSGTITTTIDNGNGSYTASLSSVLVGSALLTFRVNGITASKTAGVKFKAAELPVFDLSTSIIIANPNTIAADGIEQATVTVQLKDSLGNNITAGGETVVILTNLGTITTTTDNGDGSYAALLSATFVGSALLTFTLNGSKASNIAEVIFTPFTLELTNSTKLQSTNLYMQAAGSTGNDGSIEGIHLRWLLKGYLGETHLPKGNNAVTTNNFNKPDDFVRIYRAPYIPQYLTLDFEKSTPSIVDSKHYVWIYRINEVPFYVHFKNKIKYNTIKSTINPLVNSYSFIKAYGNEVIEIDNKTSLSFGVTIKASTVSTTIEAEALSVEDNKLTAVKYVTARKEFIGEGRLEEENVRVVRYKANHVKQIKFELYADSLAFNLEKKNWDFIGEYALSTADTVVENRLEASDGSTPIHGKWPRFNDNETVNKENYIDRWNGEEIKPYGTEYYEYYDRRLKTAVKRYIQLSDEDANNPAAMESIPFSTTLPEDVELQEDDVQNISNLTIIQLASMDYHLARMLGLGHIDTGIAVNEREKKYIYLAEYKTVDNINGEQDQKAEEIQHIYLSLPTAIVDERLPIAVNLLEPVFGTNNEKVNKLIDAKGYLYDGKQRFISLVSEELAEHQTNINFFENTDKFSASEVTTPVYVGLEYKLFDPANPNATTWQKPELSNTSDYKNFIINQDLTSVHNETIPILLPEPNETLFLHKEREEGWHRYSSYGINWFSRSRMSTVFWDIETRFKPQNRLLPPSNIKACLIVEESPLMLTSKEEQNLFKGITNIDKTLIRLTFDHNINQDRLTYQINEESMGSYTDPLNPDAIFKDSKEVFADRVNIYFRNKTPQTVAGKIKSIEPHLNNALAVIRTEAYQLASTGEEIIPNVLPNELSHFIGSIFMFNNVKYIIHEITASTIIGEGPIFTVYKEVVSQAMLTGNEPDATIPLNLPTFNGVTMFNTVENMLTESNWQVGTAAATNKLGFQITIGNNWPVHREVLDEESISGVPEKIVEKSRGIWERVTIEEVHKLKEKIYDTNGSLLAEPKHVGMYKITFPNSLEHHSQFNSHHVDWHQGIVRIHTQKNPTKKRKILEVVKIENVGTSKPLIVYAIDPQYPVNVTDVSVVTGFDPIAIGNQEINFYPGYRVYLYHDEVHHLTEEAIHAGTGEGLKYSILGLQTVDPDHPEDATNSNEWYTSKISQPALFFAQEVIRPETPLLSNGEDFVYATRPDTFGKATFSLTPGFSHIPHGVQFYRSNDDAVLNALYKPSTILEIKEKLKEDFDPKFHLVKRWQNLLGFDLEYEETYQTNGEFFVFPENETGYRFPNPDKYQLYKSINDILEYRNDNYGTSYDLLDLGSLSDDSNNGIIGEINLTDIVIPELESEGIKDNVTFKEFIKSVIFNAFTPLTEIPLMYEYIRDSEYQPVAKKQVVRDENGGLLPPTNPKFDMAPMAKRMSTELTNAIQGAKTRVLFTDFNLDGTSDNLYFYAIREMGSTMQLGDYSPVLGPIKLVNTKAPQAPEIKRVLPVLQNNNLNINPGILIEINAYPKVQNIKQIKLYRTLDPNKALSVRTMDLVKTINLETDEQILNNIWKLKDEFTDLNYVPYGDPLYYKVTALREIQYAEGSNFVNTTHPEVIEYVPSESSKLLISSIVENVNPESPVLKYSFDLDPNKASLIHHVILKWNKKVHNGKYHVYKMNSQGNWVKIYTLNSNSDDLQLLLMDTLLESGTLSFENEEGDLNYHHFKVISENSVGMMSSKENILTIPTIHNIAKEEGVGSMIIENTNIVR